MALEGAGQAFRLSNVEIDRIEPDQWKSKITPFDFNLATKFCDSPFQKYEIEIVITKIIQLLKINQDGWGPFSWREYTKLSTSPEDLPPSGASIIFLESDNNSLSDLDVFRELVFSGYLTQTEDESDRWYEVTDSFVKTLQKFIGTPERVARTAKKQKERTLEVLRNNYNAGVLLADLPPNPSPDFTFKDLEAVFAKHSQNGFKLYADNRSNNKTCLYLETPESSGTVLPFADSPDEAARTCYQNLRKRLM